MKFLQWAKDGGPESHVTGFFLVEIKPLFSIVILHFGKETREAFHSHAFNAFTLWLRGLVVEELIEAESGCLVMRVWRAGMLKYTPRQLMHRIKGYHFDAWALSIRGPWQRTWNEYLPSTSQSVTLTHGRKVVQA